MPSDLQLGWVEGGVQRQLRVWNGINTPIYTPADHPSLSLPHTHTHLGTHRHVIAGDGFARGTLKNSPGITKRNIVLPSHTTAGERSDKRPEDKLAPILKQSLVSNNNVWQAEAIAHPPRSPFSGNVLLKRPGCL